MKSDVVWLQLEGLRCGLSPREGELDRAHVEALAELEGRWPPILVSRRDDRVIDGHHRVAAAELLGHTTVAALLFDGTADDAFVEAVRHNIEHGLPLTIDERKAAARRLLTDHAEWSDRRIADVCALSPRTVGRLRAAAKPDTEGADRRVGLDGRTRSQPESRRLQILDMVRTNPQASLRTVAQGVGTSPETVRRVRHSLEQQGRTGRPRNPDRDAQRGGRGPQQAEAAGCPAPPADGVRSSDDFYVLRYALCRLVRRKQPRDRLVGLRCGCPSQPCLRNSRRGKKAGERMGRVRRLQVNNGPRPPLHVRHAP